jgi:CheY-like chemotaxis protein
MDGYELAQKMRELPGLRDIRLVTVAAPDAGDKHVRRYCSQWAAGDSSIGC